MLVRSSLAACLAVLALACGAGSAAAAPAGFNFDPIAGQAIPLSGSTTAVDLFCGYGSEGDCHGSVSLVPRGRAAADLGTDPIATSAKLSVDPGFPAEPKLGLSAEARAWVKANGPLPVTAELSSGKGPSRSEDLVLEEVDWVQAPAPTETTATASVATASEAPTQREFDWNFTLKAGTAVKLRDFKCPSDAPYVEGTDGRTYAGSPGKITVKASEGVGYGAFTEVHAKDGHTFERDLWQLTGWPKGSLWSNNVFAPVFVGGTFSMSLTCTDRGSRWDILGQAYVYKIDSNKNPVGQQMLLPWNYGRFLVS